MSLLQGMAFSQAGLTVAVVVMRYMLADVYRRLERLERRP